MQSKTKTALIWVALIAIFILAVVYHSTAVRRERLRRMRVLDLIGDGDIVSYRVEQFGGASEHRRRRRTLAVGSCSIRRNFDQSAHRGENAFQLSATAIPRGPASATCCHRRLGGLAISHSFVFLLRRVKSGAAVWATAFGKCGRRRRSAWWPMSISARVHVRHWRKSAAAVELRRRHRRFSAGAGGTV